MAGEGPKDVLVRTSELPWLPMGPGVWYRVLRVSEETGTWSILLRMETGAKFAPHRHLGPAEFFMLKGALHYRGGVAREGDYGYEPLGVVHEQTYCEEESLLTFTSYGPVVFPDDKGVIQMVLDWEFVKKQAAGELPAPSLTVGEAQAAA